MPLSQLAGNLHLSGLAHAQADSNSHIFCTDCSNRFQLSSQHDTQRAICPACDMQLKNPDDVVVTKLNPSEDYKTSVLSGLSPTIIMECAGRAMSFWAYQTTQEMFVLISKSPSELH